METLFRWVPDIKDVKRTVLPKGYALYNNYKPKNNIFFHDFEDGKGPVQACILPDGSLKKVILHTVDYGTASSLVAIDKNKEPIVFKGKLLTPSKDTFVQNIVKRAVKNARPSAFTKKKRCAAFGFLQKIVWILSQDLGPDTIAVVVFENTTPGSYGVNQEMMRCLGDCFLPVQLQKIHNQVAINYRKYHKIVKEKSAKSSHLEDCRILDKKIYKNPVIISKWTHCSDEEKLVRKTTSVTPCNSWDYSDPWGEAEDLIAKAIPTYLLPNNMQQVLCEKKNNELVYHLPSVMTILQAMEEPGVLDSNYHFRIVTSKWVGGYPCHYKAIHGKLREKIEIKLPDSPYVLDKKGNPVLHEKGKLAGTPKKKTKNDITEEERKAAWTATDHIAMAFFKMCREWQREGCQETPRLLQYLKKMADRYEIQQKKKYEEVEKIWELARERGRLLLSA